jgi:hypothetical protein
MIDLTTCVKGQKLRLRNGIVATYANSEWIGRIHYPHVIKAGNGNLLYYANSGKYDLANHRNGSWDVVEILPLETTEPPKTASHPSVAWWESCPWITDREPTGKDSDSLGQVVMQVKSKGKTMPNLCFIEWEYVGSNQAWIHTLSWQPPVLTDKEQAMELINNHSPEGNGIVEDDWKPTLEQWLIIRKGLEAS